MIIISQELYEDWKFWDEVVMPYIRRETQGVLAQSATESDDLIMNGVKSDWLGPLPEPEEPTER